MSNRLVRNLLSIASAFAAGSFSFPRSAVERREATAIPRNHAARIKLSRRSMHSARPALPLGTQERGRRVRQIARGIIRVTGRAA